MILKWANLDHWTLSLCRRRRIFIPSISYWILSRIDLYWISARGWKVLQISLFMATNMTDISWGELILKFKLENFTFLIKIYLFRASNFSKMLHNPENPLIIKWNLFILSSSLPNFNQRPSSRSRLEQDEHFFVECKQRNKYFKPRFTGASSQWVDPEQSGRKE